MITDLVPSYETRYAFAMNLEELAGYHVTVKNGSGCLFQPIGCEQNYTYILTAKHLFEGTRKGEDGRLEKYTTEDGALIPISRVTLENDRHIEVTIPFTLRRGENYFIHPEADAAILRIIPLEGFDKIIIQDFDQAASGYKIYGYPNRFSSNDVGNKSTSYDVRDIIGTSNYSRTAQLFSTTLSINDIEGMSGGAILRIDQQYISLIGIQSEMKSEEFSNGQINFIPIKYFNEIVEENSSRLSKLLPPFLKSFSFLEDEIFQLQMGLLTKEKTEKFTEILKVKATFLKKSDLTPVFIKDYFRENLPVYYAKEENELQKKKIWTIWLELLTVLSIAKRKCDASADFDTIARKVRLFYSNTNQDFWITHLPDLAGRDYSNLEEDGIVIVASNVDAGDKMHILDLKGVPEDISRVQKSRQKFQLEQLGPDTTSANDFPLDKYRFMNISAFKAGTQEQLDNEFSTAEIQTCLTILEKLYGELLPHW